MAKILWSSTLTSNNHQHVLVNIIYDYIRKMKLCTTVRRTDIDIENGIIALEEALASMFIRMSCQPN